MPTDDGRWLGIVGVEGAVSGGVGLCRIWLKDMACRKCLNRLLRVAGLEDSGDLMGMGTSTSCEGWMIGNWAIKADLFMMFVSGGVVNSSTGDSLSDSPVQ